MNLSIEPVVVIRDTLKKMIDWKKRCANKSSISVLGHPPPLPPAPPCRPNALSLNACQLSCTMYTIYGAETLWPIKWNKLSSAPKRRFTAVLMLHACTCADSASLSISMNRSLYSFNQTSDLDVRQVLWAGNSYYKLTGPPKETC